MKKIAFLFLLLISQLTLSQRTEKLEDFNKITAFDQIDVWLVEAKENKIVLGGEGAEEVEIVNKNGELKIRMPLTKLLKGDNVSATVYYKKLDAVEANEGSRIASDITIKATSFNVIAKEGAEIQLDVYVTSIKVKAANGSSVTIDGKATNQDIILNSGAMYFGSKLTTSITTITVNAGGDADVNASELVDAKVRAGGLITVFGKPKQINQKIIAGGRIEQAK
ncbi:MAG: DUF2807 domain-containing protein [Flavobacterium sp.]|nr:DUF2807 domain-containing protein [Flavobacterium sp.]